MNLNTRYCARKLGNLAGKPVYVFPVKVTFGETAALTQRCVYPKEVRRVISRSAAEAANATLAEFAGIPCVQVEVFGVRGGIAAHRYAGFESAIAAQMWAARPDARQLALPW